MKRTTGTLLACLLVATTVGCRTTQPDIIREAFPAEQAQIEKLVHEIYACAQKKELDRLATYHLYGPKFTEFKNGEPLK